jgi:hypothetical protein
LVDKQKLLHRFRINSFPRRVAGCCKEEGRVVEHITVWLELNEIELESFKLSLLHRITKLSVENSYQPPTLLIYLNPNAGANSRKHWLQVEEFLGYTNFRHELVETTHRGHCKEHLGQIDLSKYQGVVIISGDGLMH